MDLGYPLSDDTVIIDGKEYEVNMAFDNVLRLFDLQSDKTINDYNRLIGTLLWFTGESFEVYEFEEKLKLYEALMNQFFAEELERKKVTYDLNGDPMPTIKEDKVMDIKQDAPYIYASFLQDYNIDLFDVQGKLHYRKFITLLQCLSDTTKLAKVIEIRTMDVPKGKGNGKARESVLKAKDVYRLEDES